MNAAVVICHTDRRPAVALITAGQPNAWPASGRGPGGGSGGSIIHLHPCLCIMATPCDRWPVYLWIPAATEPHTHTHRQTQPASHKGQETRGAPQETPRSHTLTLGSITEAWLDVWYIHHLVQIHRSRDAEFLVCGTCQQRLSHNKLPAPITQRILWTWIKILQPVIDWMPPTSRRISRCPSFSCDLMY